MDGKGWWKKNGRYREGIWKQDELIQWLGVEQARKTESKEKEIAITHHISI